MFLGHARIERRTQEGCGGLRGENPAAFPKAGPIFKQPFSLLENAQTLAGIAFRAAGKSENNFPAASKFAGKLFPESFSSNEFRTATAFSSFLRIERNPIKIAILRAEGASLESAFFFAGCVFRRVGAALKQPKEKVFGTGIQ